MKRWAGFLLFLFFWGCSSNTASIVIVDETAKFPPKDPSQVQIVYEKPDRSYKEIAIVSGSNKVVGVPVLTTDATQEAMKKMRAKAAEVGADAVIIRETTRSGSGPFITTVTGSAIVFTDKD